MAHKAWTEILEQLEKGNHVIVAGGENYGVPSLHNFYRNNPETADRYWRSVKHLGFGCFTGRTEHGSFDFLAGGAMTAVLDEDKYIGYSVISVENPAVLADLQYDIEAAKARVKELMK